MALAAMSVSFHSTTLDRLFEIPQDDDTQDTPTAIVDNAFWRGAVIALIISRIELKHHGGNDNGRSRSDFMDYSMDHNVLEEQLHDLDPGCVAAGRRAQLRMRKLCLFDPVGGLPARGV
jgi:hypothetical protein